MNFLEIPEEMLLYILRYVRKRDMENNLRVTCKRLYDLTFDPSLWRHLEVNKYKLDSPVYLDMLYRVSGHVERISTRQGQHSNLSVLEDKQVTFPCLLSIDFDLESDDRDLVSSCLCRHPSINDVSLSGPLTDILSVVNTLSNTSDLKLNKLGLLCTDEHEGEDLERHFDGLVDFVLQNNRLETLAIHCDDIPDDVVQCLLSFKDTPVKCISLNDCSRITQSAFSGIHSLASLVTLSLDNTNADDNVLEQMAGNCPMLQFLSVQGCSLVTDVGFAHIAQHCGQLRDLIVNSLEMQSTAGRNITDHGLASLAQGCTRLKRLLVIKCPGVSSTGLIEIAEHCRELEEISVAECLSVTDAGVMALALHCSALRIVNLNSCLQITSDAVNRLVITCTRLHSLHLETCRFMSKLKFDDIIKIDSSGEDQVHTSNDTLDSVAIDNDGTRDIIRETPYLNLGERNPTCSEERTSGPASFVRKSETNANEFDFHDPRNALSSDSSDLCIRTKTKNNIVTRNREQAALLQSKSRNDSNRNTSQTQIASDFCINDVRKSSERNEEKLDLQKGYRHTQRNVRDVRFISPQHSHLRVLYFGFSSSLTDASVRQIGRHCPDLVDFSVRGCHSLSDSSVRFLLQRCRHIQILDISGGSAVKATTLTDNCLSAIAEFSSNIRILFIMKNDLITTEAVKDVILKCRYIDSIYVSCSKNSAITRENVRTITGMSTRRVSVSMDIDRNTKGAIVIKCLDW
ncbi:F-box/LRR-repeat protein 13-like [Mizuhopecten yessoensis]|uniref:F-box/LRR-repeat protein 7 n=1 Tax=Mizuhopecten yessoensis TaxID=6573 RepID=A0A210QQQ3_MIZYE|nr:F-box/LRR-repeat protein 13-like [Mizuhopecten yessoensis]XP_021352476.1 F-box/LRR-repeat protein 13-like [Mizuhopecten yessoensis]OWF51044.1 F-box/LRR-repeat protein 7 [Mizuhopecten yessoensis]